MRIFIINGMARSGKDTFINFVREEVESMGMTFETVSSVDSIKEIATEFGYDDTRKDDNDRTFLSDFKQLVNKHYNFTIHNLSNIIQDSDADVMFIQIREGSEIDEMKSLFDLKTVFGFNTNITSKPTNKSDRGTEDINPFDYDYVFDNSGTLDDLSEKASIFVSDIFESTKGETQ